MWCLRSRSAGRAKSGRRPRISDAKGRIQIDTASLPSLLTPVADGPLQYEVKGTSYRFVLYWQVKGSFTCFPMIQDIAGKNMCGKI